MQALCRYIEAHADEPLSLAALGQRVNLSPQYLQRRFKAMVGVSPKQYADACRMRGFKQRLRAGESVTDALYAAGYGSSSRVYERADSRLGMTPRQYRQGGADMAISHASAKTPLGMLMLAATDRGLCFVQLGDDAAALRENLAAEFPAARLTPMPADAAGPFGQWMAALCTYLRDGGAVPALPADIRGTAFQRLVWDYLCTIPAGELRSYSEVATAIGRPRAVRAVANACAANRLALVIPCHRVIRGDGGLGGYRWGVARKRALIERERDLRSSR